MDEELDRLKRLDIRQYAVSISYVVDRRESSSNSTVMRRDHDKIIVSRKPDGHFTYWSPRDDRDKGTIIDFVQRRKGLTLGGVRKELRAWAGTPSPALPHLPELGKTVKDFDAVRRRYAAMSVASRHPYLEGERGIPASLLQHPRFAGRVKMDRHGAAVFPHFDADGNLTGYELKNTGGFTGFASGGRKGMFLSNTSSSDRRLVITESGIDALSHAVLFEDLPNSRYASIAGKPTRAQHGIIRAAMLAMPGGSEIVAATDADDAGRQLAELLKEIFDSCGRADLTFRRDVPAGGKDWNKILTRRGTSPLPARPEEPRVV
jgi:hypothetical protein